MTILAPVVNLIYLKKTLKTFKELGYSQQYIQRLEHHLSCQEQQHAQQMMTYVN